LNILLLLAAVAAVFRMGVEVVLVDIEQQLIFQ
jgi:hypothetical protein